MLIHKPWIKKYLTSRMKLGRRFPSGPISDLHGPFNLNYIKRKGLIAFIVQIIRLRCIGSHFTVLSSGVQEAAKNIFKI